MSELIEGNKPGIVLESAATHDTPAWPSGRPMIEPAGHPGSLGVVVGSAAPVEVVEAFKRLHAVWLFACKRSDMNDQMDALATALQLHPLTLAPLKIAVSQPGGQS